MVRKVESFEGNSIDRPELPLSQTQEVWSAPAETMRSPLSARPQIASRSWRWVLIGLSICSAVGTMATAAFLWLMMLPPLPNCEQISPLAPDRERLHCAQAAAEAGSLPELLAGLSLLEQWTPAHPLYSEAQRWLADWSQAVLAIAQQRIQQNDLTGAVELASQIPRSSPVYPDAQTAIASWQQQWQQGQTLALAAQTALKNQDWDHAAQQIAALRQLQYDHWRSQQASALAQQLLAEKRARQSLAQAQRLAQEGQPAQLSAALSLISTIDTKTFAWSEAQANFNQWGKTLLAHGLQQWQQANLDSAIALAQRVSLNPNLAKEAENLLVLSQARKLALSSNTHWQTSPHQVFNLMEAIAAAQQIKSDSQFYPHAQASLESWQLQLQDLKQLQLAQLTASLSHPVALTAAIAQAQQIPANHPRRLQAQTLMAHWHEEIERLEDRPYLARARTLAAPGTVLALQAAIAQARHIALDRASRSEAQGLIYQWNQQIQTLEDQPLLDRAKTLARQGRLRDAIQAIATIQPNRALYPTARSLMRDWQAELHRIHLARTRAARVATRRAPTVSPPETQSEIESSSSRSSQSAPATPQPGARSQQPIKTQPAAIVRDSAPTAPTAEPAPPPPDSEPSPPIEAAPPASQAPAIDPAPAPASDVSSPAEPAPPPPVSAPSPPVEAAPAPEPSAPAEPQAPSPGEIP